MGIKAPGVVYALVVVGLACAAFNIGHRFQPDSYAGHNLYALHERQGWPQTTSNNFLLTGLHKAPSRVADSDPSAPQTDENLADDSFSNSPAATFQQVYLLLKRDFVDGIPDDGKLAHGAVSAMLASLQDPQSRFLEKDQLQAVRQKTEGIYGGIGAVVEVRKRVHPKVVSATAAAAAIPTPSTTGAESGIPHTDPRYSGRTAESRDQVTRSRSIRSRHARSASSAPAARARRRLARRAERTRPCRPCGRRRRRRQQCL